MIQGAQPPLYLALDTLLVTRGDQDWIPVSIILVYISILLFYHKNVSVDVWINVLENKFKLM